MSETSAFVRRGDACLSSCGRFRYWLSRRWSDGPRLLNYVMLNPSTADAETNDPTIERCMRRAGTLGYDGMYVTNLFALRSTDPRALYKTADAVGPENDAEIVRVAGLCEAIVCAWGAHTASCARGPGRSRDSYGRSSRASFSAWERQVETTRGIRCMWHTT